MTEMCRFPDRDGAVIAYVYDELDPADRGSFDAHLSTCAACRGEVRALAGVRQQLAHWSPPEPAFMLGSSSVASTTGPQLVVGSPPSAIHTQQSIPPSALRNRQWRQIPAWAQVAAALLFLGVSAAIANLDIHRDQNGFTVRTGWSRAATATASAGDASARRESAAASSTAAPQRTAGANAVTREELVALERQLRSEMRGVQGSMRTVTVSDPRSAAAGSSRDDELLRRVRALIDETEKRQNRELALRIGEVLRDVTAQRHADLMRIDRSLGLVQNDLGVEVMKQRQSLNYLMRVNQR